MVVGQPLDPGRQAAVEGGLSPLRYVNEEPSYEPVNTQGFVCTEGDTAAGGGGDLGPCKREWGTLYGHPGMEHACVILGFAERETPYTPQSRQGQFCGASCRFVVGDCVELCPALGVLNFLSSRQILEFLRVLLGKLGLPRGALSHLGLYHACNDLKIFSNASFCEVLQRGFWPPPPFPLYQRQKVEE